VLSLRKGSVTQQPSAYVIAASVAALVLTCVPICLCKDTPALPIRHATSLSSTRCSAGDCARAFVVKAASVAATNTIVFMVVGH